MEHFVAATSDRTIRKGYDLGKDKRVVDAQRAIGIRAGGRRVGDVEREMQVLSWEKMGTCRGMDLSQSQPSSRGIEPIYGSTLGTATAGT